MEAAPVQRAKRVEKRPNLRRKRKMRWKKRKKRKDWTRPKQRSQWRRAQRGTPSSDLHHYLKFLTPNVSCFAPSCHSEQSSGAEDRKRGRKAGKNQKSASESESESESSESEESSEEESGEESESDTDIRKKKVGLVPNGILAYYLVNTVQCISYCDNKLKFII